MPTLNPFHSLGQLDCIFCMIYFLNVRLRSFIWTLDREGSHAFTISVTPRVRLVCEASAAEILIWFMSAHVYISSHMIKLCWLWWKRPKRETNSQFTKPLHSTSSLLPLHNHFCSESCEAIGFFSVMIFIFLLWSRAKSNDVCLLLFTASSLWWTDRIRTSHTGVRVCLPVFYTQWQCCITNPVGRRTWVGLHTVCKRFYPTCQQMDAQESM